MCYGGQFEQTREGVRWQIVCNLSVCVSDSCICFVCSVYLLPHNKKVYFGYWHVHVVVEFLRMTSELNRNETTKKSADLFQSRDQMRSPGRLTRERFLIG